MRFLVIRSFEPGMTREQLEEHKPDVPEEIKRVGVYLNLAKGKMVAIVDAPSEEFLCDWAKEHDLSYDDAWPVELECTGKDEVIEHVHGAGAKD